MTAPRTSRPTATRVPSATPSSHPWPRIGWAYSAILPLALVLLVATIVTAEPRKDLVDVRVVSSESGEPMPGALVSIGDTTYRTGNDGSITIERPAADEPAQARIDGYASVEFSIADREARTQSVHVAPSLVNGRVSDAATGDAIASATIILLDRNGAVVAESNTDDAGAYMFRNVPEGAGLRIEAEGYRSVEEPIGDRPHVNLQLTRQALAGVVLDDSGEPVQGAVVRSGDVRVVTGSDGVFSLEGVDSAADITITASGFRMLTVNAAKGGLDSISLEPQVVKAVYANWSLLASEDGLDSLIEIANTTEINAIVVDIKQDTIYYDSQVQFFREAGTVAPVYDAAEVLQRLEENNIYAIARLVVFQDPLVAEAFPHLAVHDTSGDLWRNEMGVAWVSAFHEELWDANIELALEAVSLGFDEIQYDYVRFPSDGDLSTADFGREYTAEAREAAITEFMRRSYEAIHSAGGLLAADLFGFVTIVDDEQYIGQRFSALEPYLDYVSMMIYPSHFSEGNIASAPGHPNDYPYETILESLERAEQITPGAKRKFRPWLQDFSYWNLRPYDASDVRAQIDAAEDFGASGWMLWGDPFNVTVAALNPGTGDD